MRILIPSQKVYTNTAPNLKWQSLYLQSSGLAGRWLMLRPMHGNHGGTEDDKTKKRQEYWFYDFMCSCCCELNCTYNVYCSLPTLLIHGVYEQGNIRKWPQAHRKLSICLLRSFYVTTYRSVPPLLIPTRYCGQSYLGEKKRWLTKYHWYWK